MRADDDGRRDDLYGPVIQHVASRAGGEIDDSAQWQERALIEHPSAVWVHRTLCPAYVLGDAEAEARRSLAALRERYPELTVSEVRQGLPPLPQAYCDLVFDALHGVGLPL